MDAVGASRINPFGARLEPRSGPAAGRHARGSASRKWCIPGPEEGPESGAKKLQKSCAAGPEKRRKQINTYMLKIKIGGWTVEGVGVSGVLGVVTIAAMILLTAALLAA